MNSLTPSSESKNASSLLKASVLGTGICTALLPPLVIVLNGWKLVHPSETIKRFIDYALYSVS